mmetsp:Transcript_14611/g.24150  ORF Transcript_14611/g.24150 Transcript_14611/m.24150 type:complete len:91 (+) Transcript_14611:100-372(+)
MLGLSEAGFAAPLGTSEAGFPALLTLTVESLPLLPLLPLTEKHANDDRQLRLERFSMNLLQIVNILPILCLSEAGFSAPLTALQTSFSAN